MASPGFGFSVGDIIAGVEIAVKICKACRDTGGAPDQFHRVVLELEIYLSVLRRLQDVGCSAMPEVRTLAQFCEVPIQAFLAKIAKYEARFNSGSSSGRSYRKVVRAIKGLPRKSQWAVIASKEVEKLRAGLEAPLSALGLLLNLELRSVIGTVVAPVLSYSDLFQHVPSTLRVPMPSSTATRLGCAAGTERPERLTCSLSIKAGAFVDNGRVE